FFHGPAATRALPSFPPRRSSDLGTTGPLSTGLYRLMPATSIGFWRVLLGTVCLALWGLLFRRALFRVDPRGWNRRPQSARHTVRSEEHTSELQSRGHLVCRLLLA